MSFGTTMPRRSANNYNRTTDELAYALRIKSQTLRKRYCLYGSYFGIRPLRLPNGKLLWPDAAIEDLVAERCVDVEADISDRFRETPAAPGGGTYFSAGEAQSSRRNRPGSLT